MDLQIELQAVRAADLTLPPPKETSADVAARVAATRELQARRFQALGRPDLRSNAEADGKLLEEIAALDAPGTALIRDAAEAMQLSARGYHRVLRVARTIADLAYAERISRIHIAEALSYRQRPAGLRAA